MVKHRHTRTRMGSSRPPQHSWAHFDYLSLLAGVLLGVHSCTLHVSNVLRVADLIWICALSHGAETREWECRLCWEEWTHERTKHTIRPVRWRKQFCMRITSTFTMTLVRLRNIISLFRKPVCDSIHRCADGQLFAPRPSCAATPQLKVTDRPHCSKETCNRCLNTASCGSEVKNWQLVFSHWTP